MCRSPRSRLSASLMGLIFFGALSFTGCGNDQQQSGTSVQDTPEAEAGRKASMEGMKAIMEKQAQTKKQ